MIKRIIAICFMSIALVGCASMEAETPKQRAFAAVADYNALQSVARDYTDKPKANPEIKQAIQDTVSTVRPSIVVLSSLARGDELTFCHIGRVFSDTLPDHVDPEYAALACDGDIESVTGRALVLIAALRIVVTKMEAGS